MGTKEQTVSNVYLCIPFTRYAVITVSLPALSLLYCFLSAFFFRGKEINDTDCNVTNTIPSVSAVTGIKPQAYIWRICIGLHSTPRFFVGFVMYNYYQECITNIKRYHGLYKFLNKLCFWLYTIECSCLLSVSCISNKENYPIHEKIFVAFMITSIANMLFGTIIFRWSRKGPLTETEKKSYFWKRAMFVWISLSTVIISLVESQNLEKKSYFWKRAMFVWISLSTVGLIIFFIRHRFYCIPGAFSYFSVFEYMIAYANMGYHITALYEFYTKSLIAADLHTNSSTNGVSSSKTLRNGKKQD